MSLASRVRDWWNSGSQQAIEESTPAAVPERRGFEYGIPAGGLNEYSSAVGAATQTDRRTLMTQLFDAYVACPWAWSSVNAIARTVTAGGLVTGWDNADNDGDAEAPDKPAEVKALEAMLAYCNPELNIRQLMKNVVTDLQVFADAYVEVVWLGNQPVALYNLPSPQMAPIADEHGQITGWVQRTDLNQRAVFEPRDVIHFSLDGPMSGVLGLGPTQAALLPITSWLFAASTGKETFRKGMPMNLWVDFPANTSAPEQNKWLAQFATRNLGPRNIGTPIPTKGGAKVEELQSGKIADIESYKNQARDEIIACYGVPPSKVGIIESGNIGGGTGESQDKTFRVTTCDPLAELLLEKFNFHIVQQGFGITGWSLRLGDVDLRDSKTVEEIRDMRLRNGSWTLNTYRSDIGEPATEGGDDAVLVDRQNLVRWADMDAMSKAGIADKLKGTALDPGDPQHGQPVTVEKPEPAPVPAALAPFAGQKNNPAEEPAPDTAGKPPAEAVTMLRARLNEALATFGIREAA